MNNKQTLDLYVSERDQIIGWVQKTVHPAGKSIFCVPLKKLFKLLRISNIAEARRDLPNALVAGVDYTISDSKTLKKGEKNKLLSEYKRQLLTLEAMMTYCSYIHSRRMYGKRVWERAQRCCIYTREILNEMLDTIELVRQVTILNGLDDQPLELDTRDVTAAVLGAKKARGVCAGPIDVAYILDVLRSK